MKRIIGKIKISLEGLENGIEKMSQKVEYGGKGNEHQGQCRLHPGSF